MDSGKKIIKNKRTLILVVTRQCNLNCRYCPISKTNKSMSLQVAERAIFLFLKNNKDDNNLLIRFFGGEPLLEFDLIEKAINYASGKKENLFFNLTTNGMLLNGKILQKIKNFSNFELILSSEANWWKNKILIRKIVALPWVTINLNLYPGKIKQALNIFKLLISSGFSNFNFLPTYYVEWKQDQIRELKNFFEQVLLLTKKNNFNSIYFKNKDVIAFLPLYNQESTVDCNGDIYANNIFLDKHFEFFGKEMIVGSVFEVKTLLSRDYPLAYDYNKLIKTVFSKNIMKSTKLADTQLTNFCRKLK
jgi:sulfatase maturation enzyme AslB (radical SAM superfamily)